MTEKTKFAGVFFAAALALAGNANAQKPVIAAESTRSLFLYTRNDSTTNHNTRVRINAKHTATARINPDIFGNFIEHLGGVVAHTIAAQIVFNPDLESGSPDARAPDGWETQNAGWREGGYHSPRCVRLGEANSGAASELRQRLTRRLAPGVPLRLTLAGRAPKSPGRVVMEIRGEKILFSKPLEVTSKEWTRRELTISLAADAVVSGEPVTLILRHGGGGGPVDIDRVTLTPKDAVGAVAADTAAKAKAWDIPIIRWPGGNFASGYHWRDGIGPDDERPTRRNEAWDGLESNQFGVDEFLKFCDFLRCQPQLTVNAGNGTAEHAADWVSYCNASTNAAGDAGKLARQRAANGHAAPYRVRIWEIGNELYGGWQIGHTDPAGNAARFVSFRDAMRRADPTIRIIATGKADEFTGDGLRRNADWNRALLRAATANRGTPPDYLSIHPLVPLPGGLDALSYEAQYESAMAHPTFLSDTLLPTLGNQITEMEGPNPRTRIAPTEWGLIVGGEQWQKSPNHDSLAGAIYNALFLNAMIRSSDRVTLANMTAFAHGGGIKRNRGVLYVDPQYYVQQMFAAARPQIPLETLVTGPGRDVPQRGFLPAVANVPDVDVTAALSANKALVAFVVNRSLSEARTVTFTIAGFAAEHCRAVQLTGATAKETNAEDPNHIAPRPFPLPVSRLRPDTEFQITIPPHTFVALTFAP